MRPNENKFLTYFLYLPDSNEERLWKGLTKADKPRQIQGVEFEAGKLSRSQSSIEKRLFIIEGKHLYYRKQKPGSIPKAKFDLSWTLVEFFKLETNQNINSQDYQYIVRFNKSKKFVQIFLKNENEVEKLRINLSRSGVYFNDVHERYTVLDLLDESNFGSV